MKASAEIAGIDAEIARLQPKQAIPDAYPPLLEFVKLVEAAGFGFYPGSARDLYERDCHLDDSSELRVGMAVAVPTAPYAGRGMTLGHVGLYVGDGIVRDSAATGLRTVPLELWLVSYGLSARPRWGWVGGLALA